MNIYKHELQANIKTTLIWIFSLSSIAAVMMAFYPMFKNDTATFIKLMENIPSYMKSMLGFNVLSFTTSVGYYSFAFIYSMLFGAIQAMNLGIGIVSKEERERTADFILTKPVSREKILTSKLLAVLTIFIVTNIVYSAVSFLIVKSMTDGSFAARKFVLINASLFFSQLIFFSIGLVVSVAAKKIKAVLPVSLGLVFALYAISAFAVTSKSDKLRYITPFQYFKTDYILMNSKYETVFVVISAAIVIAGISAGYILFKHRDVHSV